MSEIDYLGQFVKAWLTFNAWYRSANTGTQDREIIEAIKSKPNAIASKFRPLLGLRSEEAEQFRAEIGMLHNRLEKYEIHHGKGSDRERIRLSQIVIRTEPPACEQAKYYGYQCLIERLANGKITTLVKDRNGATIINLQQQKYDLAALEADAGFKKLTDNLRKKCRGLYALVNPPLARDLTKGDEAPIACGAHTFNCGSDFLFAGVVEAVYLMRCSLFHGELVPTREAAECYEPAYRIIRRFLESVS
jgi:hypothetical protein